LILKYVILSQTVGALKDTVENAKGNIWMVTINHLVHWWIFYTFFTTVRCLLM
jgi:hypothetical protein